jgi:hypothetical protein
MKRTLAVAAACVLFACAFTFSQDRNPPAAEPAKPKTGTVQQEKRTGGGCCEPAGCCSGMANKKTPGAKERE